MMRKDENTIDLFPVDVKPICKIPHLVSGFRREMRVQWLTRESDFIMSLPRIDDGWQYCPGNLADLQIGLPSCHECQSAGLFLGGDTVCRLRDMPPIVYRNVHDFALATRRWLLDPDRATLGIGVQSSDSLFAEAVTGHVRRIVPLFASAKTNPHGCSLLLSTKASRASWLEGLPTENVVVSFTLCPDTVSQRYEGSSNHPDRMVPEITNRLKAALATAEMGFEVRWYLHPAVPVPGWRRVYRRFFRAAETEGHHPARITLSMYHAAPDCGPDYQFNQPPTPWVLDAHYAGPPDSCFHYVLSSQDRAETYVALKRMIRKTWSRHRQQPIVGLCREPRKVREATGLNGHCRCE